MSQKPESQGDQFYVDTFFARQPVFDASREPWGYELFYRGSGSDTTASFSDKDIATLNVVSSAILDPVMHKDSGRKVLIHFSSRAVLDNIPLALPSASTVVEVEADPDAGFECLEALARLRGEGYQVALNNFVGDEATARYLPVCDMVFIDVLGRPMQEVARLAQAAASAGVRLAAKRVETPAQFEEAQKLGFTLFQGYFFEKPQIVPGRKLSSSEVSRLNLFRILGKEECDFDELARVIQSDVSITYRLLAFVNSAAFGFSRKIDSIRQAVVMLGWKHVKSWLWLIILTDVKPKEKSSELPLLSAIRGKFLERVAALHPEKGLKPETLFFLGLFSLLEALLDTPVEVVVEKLPIEDALKDALCGKQNAYAPWLELAKSFERADWDAVGKVSAVLALDAMKVANAYYEALVWAKSFYGKSA